jgi:hypothetical protein
MCLAKPLRCNDIDALWKAAERFWRRVNKTEDCWEWTGTVMTAGYGELSFMGKKIGAHRFSFLLHNGDLEAGMCICHTCDNRLCVKPAHLYQGTYRDNYDDILRRLQDARIPPDEPMDPDFWDFLNDEAA